MLPGFLLPENYEPVIENYGKEDPSPTPEADVYAFGPVTFQVCRRDRGYQSF